MFTWEEAGLLRQMLQILFWIVVCLLVVAAIFGALKLTHRI